MQFSVVKYNSLNYPETITIMKHITEIKHFYDAKLAHIIFSKATLAYLMTV